MTKTEVSENVVLLMLNVSKNKVIIIIIIIIIIAILTIIRLLTYIND